MKDKNDLFSIIESPSRENIFAISDNIEQQNPITVELCNHNKKYTTKFAELKQNDPTANTAKITLNFGPKQFSYAVTSKEDIRYLLTDPNAQGTKLAEAQRQAEISYIKKGLINQKILVGSDDIECTIKENLGKLTLQVENKDNSNLPSINIPDKNIELKFVFYLIDKITFNDVRDISSTSPKESWWTTTKIIWAVAIVALILSLIIVFRKKIWGWIKGESKQEKKVREQLDIF